MKFLAKLLCLFGVIVNFELFVNGQFYDQENDWSFLQDKAYWSKDDEGEFHGRFRESESHAHPEEDAHSIINPNRQLHTGNNAKNYANFVSLEKFIQEEENEPDKYNEDILFKVGELYAPPKPHEHRHEFIVNDEYEHFTQRNEAPIHITEGFGEFAVKKPSDQPETPEMFDTFSVDKSQVVFGPEDDIEEEHHEVIVHSVAASENPYKKQTPEDKTKPKPFLPEPNTSFTGIIGNETISEANFGPKMWESGPATLIESLTESTEKSLEDHKDHLTDVKEIETIWTTDNFTPKQDVPQEEEPKISTDPVDDPIVVLK